MVFRKNTEGDKGRSVFRTVLYPLLFVVLVEALLLQGSLSESRVLGKLNQNEHDILKKQIQARGASLEKELWENLSNFSLLTNNINETTQHLLEEGVISFETLDQGPEECELLLSSISKELLSALYAKQTSGIFMILNTHELDGRESFSKPGIYIRDFDPQLPPPKDYSDLLWEKAPISLVNSLNFSRDRKWEPLFQFSSEPSSYDFFYEPFQSAYENKANSFEALDYGYWSAFPKLLTGSENNSITYTVPLILDDGRVYGILGIEVLSDYLKSILPHDELHAKGGGSYVLAIQKPEDPKWSPVLTSGPFPVEAEGNIAFHPMEDGGYTVETQGETYIAYHMELPLYHSNTPYVPQRWVLLGMVNKTQLHAFSKQVADGLKRSFFLTILVGVIGSIIVSRRLSKPIFVLAQEVQDAQKSRGGIPKLSDTNIREIDQFAEAFTSLSQDVVTSSARFSSILDMVSVNIGGFEIKKKEQTVFATKTFFELFGWHHVNVSEMTLEQFQKMLDDMDEYMVRLEKGDGSCLYRLELDDLSERYIRVKVTENQDRIVGVAEDVTTMTMERLRIEHERDYDLLTGLYNRRAFYRQVSELFKQPECLKNAAVLMIDLDHLKTMNDRYGHDCGDKYIRCAAQCFLENLPKSTICSRVSGDEFFFFLYGYEEKESVRQILKHLHSGIHETCFQLPDGEQQKVSLSGGISWYPEHSKEFLELMKLSDFAMYQVKRTHRGGFREFHQDEYDCQKKQKKNRESYIRKRDFD